MPNKNLPEPVPTDHGAGVDLWTRTDPRSVINIAGDQLAEAMLTASKERPELFQLDERDLYKEMKVKPNPTDNRLRLRFWDEYDRSQSYQKSMEMHLVYAGVCSKQYFYGRYLTLAEKVAWLLCPPASYMVKMEEALAFGIERLRDILEINPMLASGKVDSRLADIQMKIVALLDMRVKGAVVQKIEQKNMNLNLSTADNALGKQLIGASMEQIEGRLKELEKRDRVPHKPYGREIPMEGEVIEVDSDG
jgi:hypothetical protein